MFLLPAAKQVATAQSLAVFQFSPDKSEHYDRQAMLDRAESLYEQHHLDCCFLNARRRFSVRSAPPRHEMSKSSICYGGCGFISPNESTAHDDKGDDDDDDDDDDLATAWDSRPIALV